MDLMDFLHARLDEDEAVARAAADLIGEAEWIGSHTSGHPWRYETSGVFAYNNGIASGAELVAGTSETLQTHIARHDPARVLADVEAKRRLIAWVDEWDLDGVVSLLALPYADHPDYRPEWQPDSTTT